MTSDELKTRLENYRRTRKTSPRSLHRWLDGLIDDAQQQLHQLAQPGHSPPPDPPAPAASAPSAPRRERNTYPLDEHAPWQHGAPG